MTFKDEDEDDRGRRTGPVWVDGEPYALITHKDDSRQATGWYPVTVARKIAKAFGATLEEV